MTNAAESSSERTRPRSFHAAWALGLLSAVSIYGNYQQTKALENKNAVIAALAKENLSIQDVADLNSRTVNFLDKLVQDEHRELNKAKDNLAQLQEKYDGVAAACSKYEKWNFELMDRIRHLKREDR